MSVCPPFHRWHQLHHQGRVSGGALAGRLAPEKSSVANQQWWETPGKQWTGGNAPKRLVLVHSAGCRFRQISQNCHHYWVRASQVGNLLFLSVKEKAQKMRFVKILVFIGCWMKTFWSSLVLGIRERTGQPIPNVKGNLFESKSARTKSGSWTTKKGQ